MHLSSSRTIAAIILIAAAKISSATQPPPIKPLDQASLREYAGVYSVGAGCIPLSATVE